MKKATLWVFRKSFLPLLVPGTLVVLLLYFDDDTSIHLNMEYERQIRELKTEISQTNDSALYYRQKRQALLSNTGELEHMAREQYHMQRPSEDVFLIKE